MFENPEQAFGGTKPMLDLIEAIYAAAQRPTLWDDGLDRISTTIEGGSISLFAEFAVDTTPTAMAIASSKMGLAYRSRNAHACNIGRVTLDAT
jgi:hypothetical protein